MTTKSLPEFVERVTSDKLESWQREALATALLYTNRKPRIALSDAYARAMRAEWLKQWPEVANFFKKGTP